MQCECIAVDNDELTDILILNICKELSKRRWSLKKLADEADLPYETVKKLINKKIHKPSFFSICRIAIAFEVSIDQLAGREDPFIEAREKILSMNSEIKQILLGIKEIY